MGLTAAYRPVKKSRTAYREIRGLRYGIREWGPADGAPLVLLHGTQDTSWTFQFLVDALADRWRIVAPDWRGHGLTPPGSQGYWFHELLADLEGLLGGMFPHDAVPLVGHSLGGNLGSVYAGLRPARVSGFVSLDAFGIVEIPPSRLTDLLSQWLKTDCPSAQKSYASVEEMAGRLRAGNPRLTADKAAFLAANSSRPCAGGFSWQFPSGNWRFLPMLHTIDEWAACWSRIAAPALWIAASDPRPGTVTADPKASADVMERLRGRKVVRLRAGHNIHHDAPNELAAMVEAFLAAR